jgi:hypothetical protein
LAKSSVSRITQGRTHLVLERSLASVLNLTHDWPLLIPECMLLQSEHECHWNDNMSKGMKKRKRQGLDENKVESNT